jgi:hypothetical protein
MSQARKLPEPDADGMPSAPMAQLPKAANFQVRRPDTLQFRSLEGTCRMAGVPPHRLRRLIAKEVTADALDACDRAGRPGMVTIEACRARPRPPGARPSTGSPRNRANMHRIDMDNAPRGLTARARAQA